MIIQRTLTALGLAQQRSEPPQESGITPPARSNTSHDSLRLLNVYRAIQIHATAAEQLTLNSHRAGVRIPHTPSLLRKPDQNRTPNEFFSAAIIDLATTGNAFWKITRNSENVATQVTALSPHEVAILENDRGQIRYSHKGHLFTPSDIHHVPLMRRTGHLAGMGPIQAAREELAGAHDLQEYSARWFKESGVPSGLLTTDQKLTPDQAKEWRVSWHAIPAGQTRVLGSGLNYKPIMLNPADAQFLENKKYSTTEIARLFGIPASLFVMAVEGGSMSYSNLEQDLTIYQRFGLMTYLSPIEAAFTELLPHGQKAKFNLEGLLRTDTLTRYQAHKLAIEMGLYEADYARQIEGIHP